MSSDRFIINDITLSIPPENIEIYEDYTNNVYTPLRTNKASVVKTGHGIMRIKVRSRFSGQQQLNDLHRLVVEFKYMPFAWIDNDLIRSQLKSKFKHNTIDFEKDSLAVVLSMLQLSTDDQLVNTVTMDLEMFFFNYKPYTSNFRFKGYSTGPNNELYPVPLANGPIDPSGNISQYQRYINIISSSNDIPLITNINDDNVIFKGNFFIKDDEFPSTPANIASVQPKSNILSNVNLEYVDIVGIVDTRMYPTAQVDFNLLASAYYRRTKQKLQIQEMFVTADQKYANEYSILGLSFATTQNIQLNDLKSLAQLYNFSIHPLPFNINGYNFIYQSDKSYAANDLYHQDVSDVLNTINPNDQSIDQYTQKVKEINDKNIKANRILTNIEGIYKEPFSIDCKKEFPDSLVTTSIQVILQNNVSFLQVAGYHIPTAQYTGGNIASCIIGFRSHSVEPIKFLKSKINNIIQESLQNRRFTSMNTLEVINPIINIAGLKNVVPDRIISETLDGHVDTYNITMQFIESNIENIADVNKITFSNDDIIRKVLSILTSNQYIDLISDGVKNLPNIRPYNAQHLSLYYYNKLRNGSNYAGNELLSSYIDRIIDEINTVNKLFDTSGVSPNINTDFIADIWGLNHLFSRAVSQFIPDYNFETPSNSSGGSWGKDDINIPSINNLNRTLEEVRNNLKQIAEEVIRELIVPNDAEVLYPEFNNIRHLIFTENYGFDTCYHDMKLEVLRNENEASTNIEPKDLFFDDFYDGNNTPFDEKSINELRKCTIASYESYKNLYGTLESNETPLFEQIMNSYNFTEQQRLLLDQKFESVWNSVEPKPVPAEGYNRVSSSYPTLDSNGAQLDDYIARVGELQGKTIEFGPSNGYKDIKQVTNQEGVVQSITQSFAQHDIYFRSMQKAFPTFKIIFMEETPRGILKQSFDELYSASAVDSIEVIHSRKSPITVARISILNLYGHLDILAWKGDPSDFNSYQSSVAIQKLADETEFAPFERFMLRPGQKIKIKLGYSNDIEKLETVFIGEIVDITAGDRVEIIAQSYGKELINTIKGWNPRERLFKYHNDTQRILCAMLLQPELIHFGKWEPFGLPTITEEFESITNNLRDDNGNQISKLHHGLLPFFFASNLKSTPTDDNIFAPITPFNPDRSVPGIIKYPLYVAGIGLSVVLGAIIGGTVLPAAITISGIVLSGVTFGSLAGAPLVDLIPKPTSFSWAARFNEDSQYAYVVYQMTVWDVIKEMELRHPGCIGHPVPYGDRMTLFFGYPSLHYWKRPPTGIDITRQQRLNALLGREDIIDRYMQNQADNRNFNPTDKNIPIEREKLTELILTYRLQYEEQVGRFVPFRNYHLISADYNMIENKIRTGISDVYNTVALQYLKDTSTRDQDRTYIDDNSLSDPIEGRGFSAGIADLPRRLTTNLPPEPDEESRLQLPVYDPDNLLVLKADDNILDQDVRMGHYAYFNCIGKTMAANYALALLINNLRDIYRGEIKILGNERIKPYDTCFLFDYYNDMCGPFDVEQVIHRFSRDEGFVTCITPDLCVTANEWSTIPTQDTMFLFTYGWWMSGISITNSEVFNTARILSDVKIHSANDLFSKAVGLNKSQFLRDRLSLSNFGDLLSMPFSSLLAAGLTLTKIGLYTQLRQPVFITPLFQGNKPFIAGIDGYYKDSILVNIRGKIVQWIDQTEVGINAMISDITQYFTSNEVIVK